MGVLAIFDFKGCFFPEKAKDVTGLDFMMLLPVSKAWSFAFHVVQLEPN
jgi:hypothetical protein